MDSTDNSFKETDSLGALKQKLKNNYLELQESQSIIYTEVAFCLFWQSRIRNNYSNLNTDLYNNYLRNYPLCECTEEIEDALHYFLNVLAIIISV